MDLALDPRHGTGYRSGTQIARRVTERWAEENLYCVACTSPRLLAAPTNTAVLDFRCPRCEAEYQLKSSARPFGRRAHNSAYDVKVRAIDAGRVPNYAFLEYSPLEWRVRDLFVVPGHFVTRAIVIRRKPLSSAARRAGWVGSILLLDALPSEGRVQLASKGFARPASQARRKWQEFAFLARDARAIGGWGAEMLDAVRRLHEETGSREFSLTAFYERFAHSMAERHPENRHIRAKIRQQLQVLRDGGVITFLGDGRYRLTLEDARSDQG